MIIFVENLNTSTTASDGYTYNHSTTDEPHITNDNSQNLTLSFFRVLQILVAVFGVVGNSLVLQVLFKTKGVLRNLTNFLIGNQSVADLFTSVQLILFQLEYFFQWSRPSMVTPLGALYCFLWDKRFLLFGSYAVSTFNLTMLSLERYFAVVHPGLYIARARRRLFIVIALFSWLLGPLMQVMFLILRVSNTDGQCVVVGDGYLFLGVAIFLWDYFVPVCIMTFCYFTVLVKFRELNKIRSRWEAEHTTMADMPTTTQGIVSSESNNVDSEKDVSRSLQRPNTTITLLIVYFAYVVCWTPNQFGFLQYNLGGTLDFDGMFYRIELIMASSNSFINVLIYAFRFKTFQTGMKKSLQCSD